MCQYDNCKMKQEESTLRNNMTPEFVEKMYQKIMYKFVVEKKFKNPKYTASKMAEELGVNTRQVGFIINLRCQESYTQMVNDFRIKEAMYLMRDKNSEDMTTEEIGLQVGFSNRQTFHTAFFKQTGVTPYKYKRNHAEEMQAKKDKRRTKRTAQE